MISSVTRSTTHLTDKSGKLVQEKHSVTHSLTTHSPSF